jgi:4-hydroxybenzoate polyprenyltransferase
MCDKEVAMRYFCGLAAVILLIAFSAVNLFLPYALGVFAVMIGLAFACRIVKRRTRQECPLGFC